MITIKSRATVASRQIAPKRPDLSVLRARVADMCSAPEAVASEFSFHVDKKHVARRITVVSVAPSPSDQTRNKKSSKLCRPRFCPAVVARWMQLGSNEGHFRFQKRPRLGREQKAMEFLCTNFKRHRVRFFCYPQKTEDYLLASHLDSSKFRRSSERSIGFLHFLFCEEQV